MAMMVGEGPGSINTRCSNEEKGGRDSGKTIHFSRWITAIPPPQPWVRGWER